MDSARKLVFLWSFAASGGLFLLAYAGDALSTFGVDLLAARETVLVYSLFGLSVVQAVCEPGHFSFVLITMVLALVLINRQQHRLRKTLRIIAYELIAALFIAKLLYSFVPAFSVPAIILILIMTYARLLGVVGSFIQYMKYRPKLRAGRLFPRFHF